MKTTGGVIGAARKAAYAVLRRTPYLRQRIRTAYWKRQKRRYDVLAAGIDVDSKTVLFEAYGGRSFACSPKAIYQAMLADSRFDDYDLVWSFKTDCAPSVLSDPSLARARCITRGSAEYFETVACAGTIIVNNRLPEYVYPKEGQTYVQCWHGTPLKRLGYDVPKMTAALNTADELANRFGIDVRKWDFLLSPSPYTSQHLADAFGLPQEARESVVLEVGYPRNDVLAQVRITGDTELQTLIRQQLGIPAGKKALLYAPTWRDDSYRADVGYTFDYLIDFDAMQRELGEEWVVLFRPHYYIGNVFDFAKYEGFVINAAQVSDINDLYIAADALLTDYSSVMFDYANLGRPVMMFVPDLDHYANDIRGFYFDIHDVPGPLCMDTAQLLDEMERLDTYFERYGSAYACFVERFCPRDDGCAAQRVIERVFGDASQDR